jgi:hypothetical protein
MKRKKQREKYYEPDFLLYKEEKFLCAESNKKLTFYPL